jgi:Xaa-Pro aminopeptidase
MKMDFPKRLQNLRLKFDTAEIDAILVSQPQNRCYLSGFDGSDGYLLITGKKQVLATDFRYIEQAQRQTRNYEIFRIAGKMAKWLLEVISSLDIRSLGFESDDISFSMYQQLSDILHQYRPQIKLVPLKNMAESLRMVKEPEEVELIRQAIKITDAALDYTGKILNKGMSELELAWKIEQFIRQNGSQTVPFELIVASGPNAALPHATPSERIIAPGEPVVVDIGAKIGNYGSDLTRTFCIPPADDTYKKVYSVVLRAQLTAISGIKQGMTCAAADSLARDVIITAGYGEAFGHSLGHGVGLTTHEQPTLSQNSTEPLVDGMVVTIEPGIYLSGWGGIRIEDDVILKNGAAEVLSSARK